MERLPGVRGPDITTGGVRGECTAEYDEIGEAFEGFKALPLAQYAEVPSFLAMVGDVRGKSVLDLASGTGFYSREFKRRGAADVLGVDISGEMVAVAQQLEERDPLGVRYEVGDVADLRTFERAVRHRHRGPAAQLRAGRRHHRSGCAATRTGA